ncbi:uncharacterized protein [Miscanthus floridulus]|uniref:uncharacterized protein n=1 Tax=Miscanthus floridulus TaxID=154761 RepID=UPI00345ACB71
MDASDGDDESEVGRGPLDHLPDVEETASGASASNLVLLRGGGDALGPAIARPRAEADMPEAQALGKRVVSPVGSTAEVEQVAVRATQLPPRRTEGVPGSVKDRLAPVDTEAVPPPPPPPFRKCPADVPALAPLKALKVNPSSTAHWVVEAQATMQRGIASVRADPKEPVVQGEDVEAAPTQAGEGAPPSCEAEAHGLDEAEASLVAEATEVEAPWTSEAEAMEAGVPKTAEATLAGAGAPETTEAMMAEAGAPKTTEAGRPAPM